MSNTFLFNSPLLRLQKRFQPFLNLATAHKIPTYFFSLKTSGRWAGLLNFRCIPILAYLEHSCTYISDPQVLTFYLCEWASHCRGRDHWPQRYHPLQQANLPFGLSSPLAGTKSLRLCNRVSSGPGDIHTHCPATFTETQATLHKPFTTVLRGLHVHHRSNREFRKVSISDAARISIAQYIMLCECPNDILTNGSSDALIRMNWECASSYFMSTDFPTVFAFSNYVLKPNTNNPQKTLQTEALLPSYLRCSKSFRMAVAYIMQSTKDEPCGFFSKPRFSQVETREQLLASVKLP